MPRLNRILASLAASALLLAATSFVGAGDSALRKVLGCFRDDTAFAFERLPE